MQKCGAPRVDLTDPSTRPPDQILTFARSGRHDNAHPDHQLDASPSQSATLDNDHDSDDNDDNDENNDSGNQRLPNRLRNSPQ